MARKGPKPKKIEVTGVDLLELAQAAYELSEPQSDIELGEDHALSYINPNKAVALEMEYVNSRSVHLSVCREDGKLFIYLPWLHHTNEQLDTLLVRVGLKKVPKNKKKDHSTCCNCTKCERSH